MNWNLRKALGMLTTEELREDIIEKSIILGDWRIKTNNMYLKIRDGKDNEAPYVTYFFEHCQYCSEFLPESCFNKQGIINANAMLLCSKLRLRIKLLQEKSESKCSCNK